MKMGRRLWRGKMARGRWEKERRGKEDRYCVNTGMEMRTRQVQYKGGNVDKEWIEEGVPKQGQEQK